MAEGIKHLPKEQQETAKKLGLKLDYDFNGEAYYTVTGQNSNNSVRIPNTFFKAIEEDGDWHLTFRTNGKVAKTLKARDLWDQIAYAAWRCADPGVQYDDTINQWHTCPQVRPDQRLQPLRHRRHARAHARRNLAAHRPDDPPARARRHQPRRPGNPRHRRRVPHRHARTSTSCAPPAATASSSPPTTRSGRARAAGSRRKDLTTDDEIRLPSKPAAVQEIGEPQDPKFFQLLGLFLSDANSDATALHLDALPAEPRRRRAVRRSTSPTTGASGRYDDDYVNAADARRRRRRSTTPTSRPTRSTATLTNRRLISRLKAFVRTDARPAAASATKRSPPASPRRSTCSAACSPPTASSTTTRSSSQSDSLRAARRTCSSSCSASASNRALLDSTRPDP